LSATSPITESPDGAREFFEAMEPIMVNGSDSKERHPGGTARLIRDPLIAAAFLTRLPVRLKGDIQMYDLAPAAWSFPLVGLFVGILAGSALYSFSELNLHPLACAVAGLATAALVTGAIHEDGLADVADGFGGGASAEAKRRIMRDSRIGAFGVIALIVSFGFRLGVLAGFPGPGTAAAALVAAAVLSRAVVPVVMALSRPAASDGLGYSAGRPSLPVAGGAFLIGAAIAVPLSGIETALLSMAAVSVAAFAVARLARRQIGGYTGDVLGAVQQVAEMAVLAAIGALII